MKKIIISLLLCLYSLTLPGQDIVYDSIYGEKTYWFRTKYGSAEKQWKILYENEGIISKSKVLSAAGLLDGMELNLDYKDYNLPSDTMTYEFKTNVDINLIVYKYPNNSGTFFYYVGFRKANLGDDMFQGKYMFICPIISNGAKVNIYNGVGIGRSLVMSLNQTNISDNSLTDMNVSNTVTIQGFNVSRMLRATLSRGVLTNNILARQINIDVYPNPATNNIKITTDNDGKYSIKIFNNVPILVYQEDMYSNELDIDISEYKSGIYIIVIVDISSGGIIKTVKLVKQ